MANSLGSPFDPRSICNLILDEADKAGRAITNLALQKLLYFAQAHFDDGVKLWDSKEIGAMIDDTYRVLDEIRRAA
jgi:uncharacterized phage-associated protein